MLEPLHIQKLVKVANQLIERVYQNRSSLKSFEWFDWITLLVIFLDFYK
jgi:hypothetical protein